MSLSMPMTGVTPMPPAASRIIGYLQQSRAEQKAGDKQESGRRDMMGEKRPEGRAVTGEEETGGRKRRCGQGREKRKTIGISNLQ